MLAVVFTAHARAVFATLISCLSIHLLQLCSALKTSELFEQVVWQWPHLT